MGPKLIDAAERVRERVRAAAREQAERDRRAEAGQAESLARQDRARAARDHATATAQQEFEALEATCREAFSATSAALRRCEQADTVAAQDRKEFDRAHARRRDVALARLDADLARVDADLHGAAGRIASRLCSAHEAAGTERLATLLGLDLLARPESAARLRELVGGAEFSPLSTDEVTERRTAARQHREALDTAVREVREHARQVGAALRALGSGATPPDPTPLAAAALDAADEAAQAARDHRAALNGGETITTTTEATG